MTDLTILQYSGMVSHFKEYNHFITNDGRHGVVIFDRELRKNIGCLFGGGYIEIPSFVDFEDKHRCVPKEIYRGFRTKLGREVDTLRLMWKRKDYTEQELKLKELEETIRKAQEQIEELKKGARNHDFNVHILDDTCCLVSLTGLAIVH